MNRVVKSFSSEFRKIVAVKTWWVLAIVLAVYSAFTAAMFGFMFGTLADQMGGTAMLEPQAIADMVYSSVSSFGYVVPLLLGGLAITGEIRHRTLGLAFVAEPRRGIVLLSKTAVMALFGVIVGVIGLIGAVGAGAPVLEATGGDALLGSSDTWLLFARVLVVLALWSVLGLGLGLVVGNQALAIVIALVFTQFIEPLLRVGASFWEWSASAGRFFPGSATDAFVGTSVMNSLSSVDGTLPPSAEPLTSWQGLLVIIGYAVVLLAIGWLVRLRKDVT